MTRVEITEWRVGCNKVELTKTIKNRVGLGLAESKAITDAVLRNVKPMLELPTDAAAHDFVHELDDIGFSARQL